MTMTDIEAVIEKLWGATFMGATATPEQAALCKARYAKILAGYISPADATAMAQAAQRDAVWKAAQHLRANFQDPIVDMAASAIVALTPSSGPWQRVPELQSVYDDFAAKQKPLDAESRKIIFDNIEELYEP